MTTSHHYDDNSYRNHGDNNEQKTPGLTSANATNVGLFHNEGNISRNLPARGLSRGRSVMKSKVRLTDDGEEEEYWEEVLVDSDGEEIIEETKVVVKNNANPLRQQQQQQQQEAQSPIQMSSVPLHSTANSRQSRSSSRSISPDLSTASLTPPGRRNLPSRGLSRRRSIMKSKTRLTDDGQEEEYWEEVLVDSDGEEIVEEAEVSAENDTSHLSQRQEIQSPIQMSSVPLHTPTSNSPRSISPAGSSTRRSGSLTPPRRRNLPSRGLSRRRSIMKSKTRLSVDGEEEEYWEEVLVDSDGEEIVEDEVADADISYEEESYYEEEEFTDDDTSITSQIASMQRPKQVREMSIVLEDPEEDKTETERDDGFDLIRRSDQNDSLGSIVGSPSLTGSSSNVVDGSTSTKADTTMSNHLNKTEDAYSTPTTMLHPTSPSPQASSLQNSLISRLFGGGNNAAKPALAQSTNTPSFIHPTRLVDSMDEYKGTAPLASSLIQPGTALQQPDVASINSGDVTTSSARQRKENVFDETFDVVDGDKYHGEQKIKEKKNNLDDKNELGNANHVVFDSTNKDFITNEVGLPNGDQRQQIIFRKDSASILDNDLENGFITKPSLLAYPEDNNEGELAEYKKDNLKKKSWFWPSDQIESDISDGEDNENSLQKQSSTLKALPDLRKRRKKSFRSESVQSHFRKKSRNLHKETGVGIVTLCCCLLLFTTIIVGATIGTAFIGTTLALKQTDVTTNSIDPVAESDIQTNLPVVPVVADNGCTPDEIFVELKITFDSVPKKIGILLQTKNAVSTVIWNFAAGSFGSFTQIQSSNKFGICLSPAQRYTLQVSSNDGSGLISAFAGQMVYGNWTLALNGEPVVEYNGNCNTPNSLVCGTFCTCNYTLFANSATSAPKGTCQKVC